MFSSLISKFDLDRFFIGEGPQPSPYVLTQRRVYILPTKQGLAFGLLLFIMLLGSINYANSLGYMLTFLLASLAIVTIFHTYNNLLRLEIGPAITVPCFAGDIAIIKIRINNPAAMVRHSLCLYSERTLAQFADISAQSVSFMTLRHCFNRRGLQPVPRFTLESRYPLGLFRAWSIIEPEQQQLVYPRPSADRQLPLNSAGGLDGNKTIDLGSHDFRELRSYVPGDPLQHVHWKSAARHHTLLTKEFSSTAAQELWLNWQQTSVSGSEAKLSQLTRWVLLATKENIPFGLKLPGIEIKPTLSPQHTAHCLKQLALYGSGDADG